MPPPAITIDDEGGDPAAAAGQHVADITESDVTASGDSVPKGSSTPSPHQSPTQPPSKGSTPNGTPPFGLNDGPSNESESSFSTPTRSGSRTDGDTTDDDDERRFSRFTRDGKDVLSVSAIIDQTNSTTPSRQHSPNPRRSLVASLSISALKRDPFSPVDKQHQPFSDSQPTPLASHHLNHSKSWTSGAASRTRNLHGKKGKKKGGKDVVIPVHHHSWQLILITLCCITCVVATLPTLLPASQGPIFLRSVSEWTSPW